MSGNRANRGSFKPGQSGNPGGRPSTAEISALCRRYTADWVAVAVDYCRQPRTAKNGPTAIAAARLLAEFGYPGHAKATAETVQTVRHMHLLAVMQGPQKLLEGAPGVANGVWGESGTEDSADSDDSPLIDLTMFPPAGGALPHEALPLWDAAGDAADQAEEGNAETQAPEAPAGGAGDA